MDQLPTFSVAVGDTEFVIQPEDFVFAPIDQNTWYGGIQSRGNNPFDILGDTFLKSIYAVSIPETNVESSADDVRSSTRVRPASVLCPRSRPPRASTSRLPWLPSEGRHERFISTSLSRMRSEVIRLDISN